ncbi:MAG TPA: hypothetical protein VML75_24870, partial [Kofleriaceae bacterium]|nr:hypothetical protein [Kofleriaceae bacterium]
RFRIDVVARDAETLRLGDASYPARRIDGIATQVWSNLEPDPTDTYPFIVWLSDDDQRIPLLIHVQNKWGGVVEIELTEYRSPNYELRR